MRNRLRITKNNSVERLYEMYVLISTHILYENDFSVANMIVFNITVMTSITIKKNTKSRC